MAWAVGDAGLAEARVDDRSLGHDVTTDVVAVRLVLRHDLDGRLDEALLLRVEDVRRRGLLQAGLGVAALHALAQERVLADACHDRFACCLVEPLASRNEHVATLRGAAGVCLLRYDHALRGKGPVYKSSVELCEHTRKALNTEPKVLTYNTVSGVFYDARNDDAITSA